MGDSRREAGVWPMLMPISVASTRSIYRNCGSIILEPIEYSSSTEANCVRLYSAMKRKVACAFVRPARPSAISESTQSIELRRDVNGEATEASASERAIPADATFRAPQSIFEITISRVLLIKYIYLYKHNIAKRRVPLHPSPHIPHVNPISCRSSISCCFWSGSIRANTVPTLNICS